MKKTDIIISGAGMVGTITALTLAQLGFSVVLIDHAPPCRFNEEMPQQLRVSAIAHKNLQLLKQLGVLPEMVKERLGYYHKMSVWDNRSTGELDFDHQAGPNLGAIIENRHIAAVTQKLLLNHPQVELLFENKIEQWHSGIRHVDVVLASGEEIEAAVLIAAEGANSIIREKAGIAVRRKDYQQSGLVCNLHISQAPEKTALQAFNATGPVGILPLNNGLFSIVWSMPNDQVEFWLQADKSKFINGLKAHVNRDFGHIELISDRAAFPLKQMYAQKFYQDRVVLIGDAAHTVHPLAGQGVNLGIEDGQCLAALFQNINLKNSEELAGALKIYQRRRRAEVFKTSEMMTLLHHLFTTNNKPLSFLRDKGMNILNQINPLKSWLIEQAGS
ncbi:MAG: FAD-dependent monooxygenase [Marinicella sp.]